MQTKKAKDEGVVLVPLVVGCTVQVKGSRSAFDQGRSGSLGGSHSYMRAACGLISSPTALDVNVSSFIITNSHITCRHIAHVLALPAESETILYSQNFLRRLFAKEIS
jgi:hypothetical protein